MKAKLSQLLHDHDWTFEMADDHRSYTNGCRQQAEIIDLCHQLRDLPLEERKQIFIDSKRDWTNPDRQRLCRPILRTFFSDEELRTW